jgi:thiamine biosynthesis lipoprotein
MKRRLFVATPLLLAALRARARPGAPAAELPLLRAAGTAFGTIVTLCALPDAQVDVAGALHRAVQAVQRIDELLSLYRPDSQLSELNRTGRLEAAHPHLLNNLRFGLALSRQTQGAFDVTVQPLWELFAAARAAGALPSAAQIARARARVDWRAVRVEGERVRLLRAGASVTLNALAQGYAVDVVLASLRQAGVTAALIDTGEIGNLGRREAGRAWAVGVQHPRQRDGLSANLLMDGRVVSTSGDYATAFSSDFRYHHIFDPATGVSPLGLSSTVVMARSGLVADGLSTALMVLDRARGEQLLRAYPGVDAVWMDKEVRISSTSGVPFA